MTDAGTTPLVSTRRTPREIGLAIVGAGRVGSIRGTIAARYPAVRWIGIAELVPERGQEVAGRVGADFVTTDHRELLRRPEVTAVIVATEGHRHTDPVLAALDHPGRPALLVEKPIATTAADSERVLAAIRAAGVDVVLGYTQRFRRRWLVAKDKASSGALGEVTTVATRAFLNRLLGVGNYRNTGVGGERSPMTVSGTHVLDLVRWFLAGRTPVEVYARSVDRVLGPRFGGIDGTVGVVTYDDGAVHSSVVNWALPTSWPGAVYSLEVGIVGTEGVLTIDDTHRDAVLAVSEPQQMGYVGDPTRLVDFVGSYPPGDLALGAVRGPMHEETNAWLTRVAMGVETHHATAEDGHELLMLAKAFDRSARLGQPLRLPIGVGEADATT